VADGRLTTAIQWAMGEGLMRRLLVPFVSLGPNGDFSGWFPPAQFHIDAICSGGIAAGAGGQVTEGDVVVRDVD
jgi:hypothetical protein